MCTRCPDCGGPVRTVKNPFYGTGLAVHESIVACQKCSRVLLEHERREVRVEPVEDTVVKWRFFRRAERTVKAHAA